MSVAACPGCSLGSAPQFSRAASGAEAKDRTIRLSVPDLRCAGCISTVEKTVAAVPGVVSARVNFSQKRVTATVRAGVGEETLIAALAKVGRTALTLNNDLLAAEDDPAGRALLAALGVAGFAMMNVMLLSVSVWSGAEATTREFLHWISASIALPAVAFSARPFFVSAWKALSHRQLNMDVPIAVAIALAAMMSLYEVAYGGRHAYFDAALSLTFFLLLGRYLDHRTRIAARSAAQELSALEASSALRLTDHGEETVDVDDLSPGDRIRVAPGMRVPVDGIVETDIGDLDRSHLTGEAIPQAVRAGDVVESGALVLTAPLIVRATAVGADTSIRRMAEMISAAEAGRAKYASLADRAARLYAPAVHLLALAAFAYWVLATNDPRLAMNIAVAVLIITCPCALALAAPAVATAAAGSLFRKGLLLKRGDALERLAEVDTIVFDKTGTLTTGEPKLIDYPDQKALAVAAALAKVSSHPYSRAIIRAANEAGVTPPKVDDVRELPGRGVEAQFDGKTLRLGAGVWLGASQQTGASTWLQIGEEAPQCFSFQETLRPGAANLVDGLHEAGMAVKILSGDDERPAREIASQLQIPEVHAGLQPDDKAEMLASLANEGQRVLMIGDGLNDAAALSLAHVSIAPASALDCARAASDIVLLGDDLSPILAALRVSRSARRRIMENFTIAIGYNLIAVPIALIGLATPLIAALAMSVSSISVSLNAMRVSR